MLSCAVQAFMSCTQSLLLFLLICCCYFSLDEIIILFFKREISLCLIPAGNRILTEKCIGFCCCFLTSFLPPLLSPFFLLCLLQASSQLLSHRKVVLLITTQVTSPGESTVARSHVWARRWVQGTRQWEAQGRPSRNSELPGKTHLHQRLVARQEVPSAQKERPMHPESLWEDDLGNLQRCQGGQDLHAGCHLLYPICQQWYCSADSSRTSVLRDPDAGAFLSLVQTIRLITYADRPLWATVGFNEEETKSGLRPPGIYSPVGLTNGNENLSHKCLFMSNLDFSNASCSLGRRAKRELMEQYLTCGLKPVLV